MGLFLLFLLFFVLCKSNLQIKATENKTGSDNSRLVQSIKTDIEKPFDKSITIDNSKLNVVDFIVFIRDRLLLTLVLKCKIPVLPRKRLKNKLCFCRCV